MPACRDCQFFRDRPPEFGGATCQFQPSAEEIASRSKLGPDHRPYSRNCVAAIMHTRLPLLSGEVLEIGAGTIKTARRLLSRHGKATWSGVDPKWRRPKLPGAYRGTVGSLPFWEDTFDHVISFESMEHWEEHGDSIPKGLAEIKRVLKPGGRFLATVPIHGHGNMSLVAGDMPTIRGWFSGWGKCIYTEWRKDFSPCPPAMNWLIWGEGRYAEAVRRGSDQPEPSMWCLEIEAWKE